MTNEVSNKNTIIWLLTFILLVYASYYLKDVLIPFIFAICLSYIFNPITNKIASFGINKNIATILIIFLIFLIISLILLLVLPIIYEQTLLLKSSLPKYKQLFIEKLQPLITNFFSNFSNKITDNLDSYFENFSINILDSFINILSSILTSSATILNIISIIFITPFATYYILSNFDNIITAIKSYIPLKHKKIILMQCKEIDNILHAYLKGQFNVSTILAAYYGVSLHLLGIKHGLNIGIFTGLICFIPYLGFATGLFLALLVTITQFFSITNLLLIIIIFTLGQLLESYLLVPQLIGTKIGVHPLWILFTILAGASLFGFLGVLIAVPVAAIIGVLIKFMLNNYLSSSLYHDYDK